MFEFFGTIFTIFLGVCIGYFGKPQIDKLLKYVIKHLKELENEETDKIDHKDKSQNDSDL